MKRTLSVLCIILLVASVAGFAHEKDHKRTVEDKQIGIDQMAEETLKRLYLASAPTEQELEDAVGYAVFHNTKVGMLVTGGGGIGVVVNKNTGERTYMKMGTAGIGFSLGAQIYQVIFVFHNEDTLKHFIDSGWEGETQANLAAGTMGANAAAAFIKGKKIYQLTDSGVMASADIAGTKYWVSKKLN
jgi:lipid-binding SYLF domain-containing protein